MKPPLHIITSGDKSFTFEKLGSVLSHSLFFMMLSGTLLLDSNFPHSFSEPGQYCRVGEHRKAGHRSLTSVGVKKQCHSSITNLVLPAHCLIHSHDSLWGKKAMRSWERWQCIRAGENRAGERSLLRVVNRRGRSKDGLGYHWCRLRYRGRGWKVHGHASSSPTASPLSKCYIVVPSSVRSVCAKARGEALHILDAKQHHRHPHASPLAIHPSSFHHAFCSISSG